MKWALTVSVGAELILSRHIILKYGRGILREVLIRCVILNNPARAFLAEKLAHLRRIRVVMSSAII